MRFLDSHRDSLRKKFGLFDHLLLTGLIWIFLCRENLLYLDQQVVSLGAETWELEINRKAAGRRHFLATQLFSMLHCSFSFVATQLLVKQIKGPRCRKNDCCSAVFAMKLQCNSVYVCSMLQEWGLVDSFRMFRRSGAMWAVSKCDFFKKVHLQEIVKIFLELPPFH